MYVFGTVEVSRGYDRGVDSAGLHLLSERDKPVVFILWGNPAKAKKNLIDGVQNLILEGAHPSPFSAYNGFFGGHYFSRANEYLVTNGMTPINWMVK